MNFQLILFFIILIILLSSSIFIIYSRRNTNNDTNQLFNNDINQLLINNDIISKDINTKLTHSSPLLVKYENDNLDSTKDNNNNNNNNNEEEIKSLKKNLLDLSLKSNHFDKELLKCDKRTMQLNEEIILLKKTIEELNLKNNHFDKELFKSKQLTEKCENNLMEKNKKNDTLILIKDKDKNNDKKNHLHSVKTVERDAYMMGLDASIMPLHHKKITKKDDAHTKSTKNSTKTIKSSDKSSPIVVKPTNKSIPSVEKKIMTPAISDEDLSKIINAVSSSTTIASSLVEMPISPPPLVVDSAPILVDSKDIDVIKKLTNKIKEPMPVNFIAPNISNSLPSSFDPTSGYEGPFFYMYELDKEFWWRWPDAGTDCGSNGYVGHEHAELSGMGSPILPDNGLFLTWHFSLFSSLYNRMKRSKRRTLDPEKASLFIIPYDLGLDGYLNHDTCTNSRRCQAGLPQKLEKFLSTSKYFHRYDGGDHAVLWSLGQYHPWPHNGCDTFMKNTCHRCTFTCYWMDSTKPDNRFISVPFPSAYHWHDEIKNLPWDLNLAPYRNLTAVYLGSTQTLNPAHTKIRRAMTVQCNASSSCHWLQIAHNSKDNSIGDFLSTYKRSVFCLCPPGDDPARKAVFDSIVSGCIPVIFEKATLYNQYPWHLGEQLALDISVSVPGALVRSGKLDFMSVLLNISPEVIKKKQEALVIAARRVQYAMPPMNLLKDIEDETPWEPAFPDGVDITLDGLFERTGHIIRNESTNLPPPHQLVKAWHNEYDVVVVKTPGKSDIKIAGIDSSDSSLRGRGTHPMQGVGRRSHGGGNRRNNGESGRGRREVEGERTAPMDR